MGNILKSKWFWAAAVALVLLGLYAVLGFYAAPRIVRSQATDFVREKYGRELALGEIRIDPFKLQAEIKDLSLPDTDGQPMLAFRRFFVDFELSSLWQRAYVFKDVQLDAPLARTVIRPDGSVNLADLALPAEEDADEPLPAVWIQQFALGDGTVQFADLTRRVPLERQFTPVDFELENFRTTAEGGAFGLTAKTQNAELLEWHGKFALEPQISSTGELAITNLNVPGVLEVAGVELPFVIPQGEMDLRGSYKAVLDETLQLDLRLPLMHFDDLSLRARGLAEDYVTVPAVMISDTRIAMPANTVALGTIAADGVKAAVWTMPDGTLNIDQLFAAQPAVAAAPDASVASATSAAVQAGEPAAVPTAPAAPWTVTVANLMLRDAAVSYEDRAVTPVARFELSSLAVTANNASLELSQPLPVKFDATINGTAKLTGNGKVVPEPFAADVDIDLAGLPLQALQPYANGTTDLTIKQGTVGATGRFALAPPNSGRPQMSFTGDAVIADFKSIDNALEQDFLNFERVELSKLKFALAPDSLGIERVRVVKPFARVIVSSDAVLNVSAVFDPQGTAAAVAQAKADQAAQEARSQRKQTRAGIRAEKQAEKEAAKARKLAAAAAPPELREAGMPIRIREVQVVDGTMDFADFSVQPNFAAAIGLLNGAISGMSSDPNSHATVKLDGRISEFSPVLIAGTIQPFAYERFTDIVLKFENISLPVFNPYSGKFAGYNIAKGKLFTDLHYRIDHRKLEAQHKIRIDQLEWGEATAGKAEATLPVKFATSLLKDADGVINLDIPVSGTIDDPSFRVGPIVWQIIKNILAKAVTAPFKALGALFKGAEEAQFIDFAAGSAALDPAAAERLGALGRSLAPKPDLRLEVPIGADAALDGAALADARYQRELQAAMRQALLGRKHADGSAPVPAFATLSPAQQDKVLTTLYTQLTGAEPVVPELDKPADEVSRKEARAQAGQARLAWLERESRARSVAEPRDLDQLGQQRGTAVQHALVTDTGLPPARVFFARDGKVSANEQQVRLELAVK
ncbi:MAG: DUF748 domain-containing protein [Steroidobacteraceae bacterium]|nr:DUF748 domain-containing protein [Steroidobacteraceae bacterium]MBP7012403.1 DUF748 domain-containing protein [Steroidobacteraceae bacterium]